MLKSSLWDYSNLHILVKRTITVPNIATAATAANNDDKKVIFKNCASFNDCISEINNTQVDNAKDVNVVMPMYNLTEYGDNCSKISETFWQYCGVKPALNNFRLILKKKITDQMDNNSTKNVEITVPLKISEQFLENSWNTFN